MEDLHLFSLVCPLLTIIVMFVMLRNVRNNKVAMRLPGPRQLPLIGNMHNLIGSLPHRGLRDLSSIYGPFMLLQLGAVPTIVVSSAEMAEQVFKVHGAIFADRPQVLAAKIVAYNCGDIVFSPYGDNWRRMRKICTMELLSTRMVNMFRSVREDEVSNLLQSISSSSSSRVIINLSKLVFSLTSSIVSRATLGQINTDPEEFSSLVDEVMKLFSGFCFADMYPSIKFLHNIGGFRTKAEKVQQQMDKIFSNIIRAHRDGNILDQESLVDVLLRLQKQAAETELPMTDDFIKALIFDMFNAGSDTSATVIDWAMSEMMKHPGVMERAHAELRQMFCGYGNVDETRLDGLKYFHCVIKETLRLHPPAPLVPRENREECVINGYTIAAKSRVIINAWAISRDPKYWGADADLFKPERFLDDNNSVDYRGTSFEYIPFGAGKRMCPGFTFAVASVELPLAQLLYHFDWMLPDGLKHEELDMTELFGGTVKRRADLNLIALPWKNVH